jgi:hypothetical protein
MQSTDTILLIRPANFGFNIETAGSNAFQKGVTADKEIIKQKTLEEFEIFAAKLKAKGVKVVIFDDTASPEKPDAIFPNNWISLHSDGKVILYSMFAENRRTERRKDIIEALKQKFIISDILDLSSYEKENKFLEGTGSIVFDNKSKVAYACISPRTDKGLFLKVCEFLNYKAVCFSAHDRNGKDIYHTNVLMCIAQKFAVICLDCISTQDRKLVTDSLANSGHELIPVSVEQMENFAGNMLALKTKDGKSIIVLSQTAFDSLTKLQKDKLGKYSELVPLSINNIETIGGGSARCMIGEIFLQRK